MVVWVKWVLGLFDIIWCIGVVTWCAQSDVSVITPSNANTSVDNRAQVTPGNNTNAPDNIKQTQDPLNMSITNNCFICNNKLEKTS
jgi:hypothetical protein